MTLRLDRYHRLESRPNDRDLQNGFAARVHDPLWLLARQWHMGEHQGENASSPVRVDARVARTPIDPLDGDSNFDPRKVPAEALVESETDDWWTMSRRIRIGALFQEDAALEEVRGLRLGDPPPPYEAFADHLDGRALWRRRVELALGEDRFGGEIPADSPEAWDSFKMNYRARFESAERALDIQDHHGGPMDWFSADASTEAPLEPPPSVEESVLVPTPLEYPGAPHSRFWEIEDAAVDIGGYPPDIAHFATMLLVDLVYSHGDDWFLYPVTAGAGEIVTVTTMTVWDSFGRKYSSETLAAGVPLYPGLHPPADFSIFRCDGLNPASLVLWPVAESPLESEPVERVQFGIDEQANVLWALERVIDLRTVSRETVASDAGHLPYPPSVPVADLQGPREYSYIPATGVETGWHPYIIDWSAQDEPVFVQWGLADYSLQTPRPTPHPRAEVLKAKSEEPPTVHRISAAAMAPGGLEFERRWELARDTAGNPILWMQRQRRILRNPPARTIQFDVMEETAPAPPPP